MSLEPSCVLVESGGVDVAEQLDLGLELDAEALAHATLALGHQRDHVGGGRLAPVLDEVRVLLGEAGSADAQAAAASKAGRRASRP